MTHWLYPCQCAEKEMLATKQATAMVGGFAPGRFGCSNPYHVHFAVIGTGASHVSCILEQRRHHLEWEQVSLTASETHRHCQALSHDKRTHRVRRAKSRRNSSAGRRVSRLINGRSPSRQRLNSPAPRRCRRD